MAKRQLRCDLELAAHRHQTHLAIVAHPDRWLVSSQKSLYRRVLIVVWADADLVLTSHDRPVCHAERCGDSRDHSAVIIFGRTRGADHLIDAIDRLLSHGAQAFAETKSETHRDNHGDDRDRSRLNRAEHQQVYLAGKNKSCGLRLNCTAYRLSSDLFKRESSRLQANS